MNWIDSIGDQASKLRSMNAPLEHIQDLVELSICPGIRSFNQLKALEPQPKDSELEALYKSLIALEVCYGP